MKCLHSWFSIVIIDGNSQVEGTRVGWTPDETMTWDLYPVSFRERSSWELKFQSSKVISFRKNNKIVDTPMQIWNLLGMSFWWYGHSLWPCSYWLEESTITVLLLNKFHLYALCKSKWLQPLCTFCVKELNKTVNSIKFLFLSIITRQVFRSMLRHKKK